MIVLTILFDEMYEGRSEELREKGIHAISVRELRDMGFHIQFDYSVITYAEKNKMILITEDKEVYGGCTENQIPCVLLGQNPSVEEIIESIKKFENLV